MKKYSELLRDPRWQKKRLLIMERDGWKCVVCGNEKTTLNVHHKSYAKNGNPWDVPDDELLTLCEDCHSIFSLPFESSSTRKSFNVKKFVDGICLISARYCFSKIEFHKGDTIVTLRNDDRTSSFIYALWTLSHLKKFIEENGEFNLFIKDGDSITDVSDLINPMTEYEISGEHRVSNLKE